MWSCSGAERCTGSEEERWQDDSVSTIALFSLLLFVRYGHRFLLLYSLQGEVTYHQFLDLLRSQLLLSKLSTAACAKSSYFVREGETDTFIYAFALQQKKKNIICRSILRSCCCLQEVESWTESV